MLIEVGPNEQVIYEEDLIHEANMRAEKKEKLINPSGWKSKWSWPTI